MNRNVSGPCPCCEDIAQNADRTAHQIALQHASQYAQASLDSSKKYVETKGINLDFAVDMMSVFWTSTFRHWQKTLQNQAQQQYLTSVYTKHYFDQKNICSQHAEFFKFT